VDDNGQRALVESVAVLDADEKTVILALFVDRKSYRELGREMNCSARTIQRIRAAATTKLAEALADEAESLLNPVMPEDTRIPLPSAPLTVPWNRCRVCDGIGETTEGLCERCLPVAVATAMAARR
jgi:hypothetical protein